MGIEAKDEHLANNSDSEEEEGSSSEEGSEEEEEEEEESDEEEGSEEEFSDEEEGDGEGDDEGSDGEGSDGDEEESDEEEDDAMVAHDEDQNARGDEEDPENFDDEKEEEEQRTGDRARIFALILCCCCCILIIVGVILGLTLFRGDNEKNGSKDDGGQNEKTPTDASTEARPTFPPFPTLAPNPLPPSARPPPTQYPTASPAPSASPSLPLPTPRPTLFPTLMPTLTPAPTQTVADIIGLPPYADTTIFEDGVNNLKFEATGKEDSFLVQDGLAAKNEIPDAYGLMAFDMSDIPSEDRLWDRDKQAILRLVHKPSVVQRGPATLHIVRLPSTRLDVETLHGGFFFPRDGIEGPAFQVAPTDTIVEVDISNLIFGNYSFEFDQLFLMIENRGPEQEEGDRFTSREAGDDPPQIIFSFPSNGSTRSPTASPAPSGPRSTRPPVQSMGPSATGTSENLPDEQGDVDGEDGEEDTTRQ